MSTPLCILLVDDSPFFLNLERQFLRNTPASLLEAKNADEALALARSHRPSLVFMDIDMPETDGLACCRQFQQDKELQGIPVILVGDKNSPDQQSLAAAAGSAGYLAKPLDRRQFLEAGHRLLISIDRREPRLGCEIPVMFEWGGVERHGRCVDISSGGMFLQVDPRAGKGELLPLRLRLPDQARTVIRVTGRIAWVNLPDAPIKQHYPAGYGVEFIDIPEETGIILRRCFGV